MCQRMVDDGAPQMAPDVEVIPAYRTAGVRKVHTIGAYVGVPIQRADGGLFGALCGLDPSAQSNDLRQHEPLLELLCTLLSGILELDTQRSKAQSRLERSQLEAETDILTGLLNRRGWDQAQAQEEERHHRFGDPGAVLVVDLDGLKIINDTMGHAAGDEHLRLAAQTLREVMRPGDSVARLGGDEFAVLVMGVTSSEMGSVASRMQAALDRIGVSASFGYAMFTAAATFNGVFALADKAMYAQKHGRSRRTPA
jgi:diguanylate cyclase (GGDEF)-like protein